MPGLNADAVLKYHLRANCAILLPHLPHLPLPPLGMSEPHDTIDY